VMVVRPAAKGSCCPACQRISRRTHSWYSRRLGDLPWEGIPVCIELHVRRFFCDNDGCGQRVFTERLARTAPRYARRTGRLSVALEQVTRALGGSAGARLAQQLGILASGSTLLRQLRRKAFVACARAPRVLGIDDWAWRKALRKDQALFGRGSGCISAHVNAGADNHLPLQRHRAPPRGKSLGGCSSNPKKAAAISINSINILHKLPSAPLWRVSFSASSVSATPQPGRHGATPRPPLHSSTSPSTCARTKLLSLLLSNILGATVPSRARSTG